MMPVTAHIFYPKTVLLGILMISANLCAQDPQTSKFYEVQVSNNEIYAYTNLKFTGDYTTFESPSGFLALGRTEEGVTIVMIVSEGTFSVEAPEAAQEKFKQVFSAYPLKIAFKTLFMRLHPKEYGETFGKLPLTKVTNEEAFTAAKQLFDDSFMRIPYHAGAKALLPPYRTRVMEFSTAEHGRVWSEEGYWLVLRKYSPYGSVYPRDFVNPKQK